MKDIIQFISNHYLLSVTWLLLIVSIIFTTMQNRLYIARALTCNEVVKLINTKDSVIIDLRNQEDYCKGRIPNSLHLSIKDIKSGNLNEFKKIKHKPIILVCINGIYSKNLVKNFNKAGFQKVFFLREGILKWNEEHLPLV